jgi:hypothetical protein
VSHFLSRPNWKIKKEEEEGHFWLSRFSILHGNRLATLYNQIRKNNWNTSKLIYKVGGVASAATWVVAIITKMMIRISLFYPHWILLIHLKKKKGEREIKKK